MRKAGSGACLAEADPAPLMKFEISLSLGAVLSAALVSQEETRADRQNSFRAGRDVVIRSLRRKGGICFVNTCLSRSPFSAQFPRLRRTAPNHHGRGSIRIPGTALRSEERRV